MVLPFRPFVELLGFEVGMLYGTSVPRNKGKTQGRVQGLGSKVQGVGFKDRALGVEDLRF